jgi:hypothetical protein
MGPEGSLPCSQVCHWPLSWARCIQLKLSLSLMFSIILSYYLHLVLPSSLLPTGFSTKILYAFLISPMRATWPAYLFLLDLITLLTLGEAQKLWSSTLCSLFQPPATSSLLGPNIHLSALLHKHLNLCPYLSMRDQISNPHKEQV